jgi:uncharacterized protein (DUF488 family)
MTAEVLTIGHSTLDYESFLALLREAKITAVADVRSSPYSRNDEFNRETLKSELSSDGISYVYLGTELGGRPENPEFFCDGIADYEKMAEDKSFKSGIKRVIEGARKYRIALMCSEHNPLDCHRCLLVGRALFESGIPVRHIVSDGRQISQTDIEEQLIKECGHGLDDMFAKGRARIAEAYRERARQVSYRKPDPLSTGPVAAE